MSTFQITVDLQNLYDLSDLWDVLREAVLEVINSSLTLVIEVRQLSQTTLTITGRALIDQQPLPDSTVITSSDSE